MTGDEVWDTLFCLAWQKAAGYDAGQVNDLCRRVAAEFDAGGSARPLILDATFRVRRHGLRYDIDAVDWFLDQFLLPQGHPGLGGTEEDPWDDLPVVRVAQRASEKYAFEVQCDSAWRNFGQLPGTPLWFRNAGWGLTELRTAEQQTLASVRGVLSETFSAGGRSFRFATSEPSPAVAELLAGYARDMSGHYAENRRLQADPRFSYASGLADETGTPILYMAGRNYGRAGARIVFPDQRWLRFLVRGSEPANGIMTAVDQAGNRVVRYRCTDEKGRQLSLDPPVIDAWRC